MAFSKKKKGLYAYILVAVSSLVIMLSFQNCIGVLDPQFQTKTSAKAASKSTDLHAPVANSYETSGPITISGIFSNTVQMDSNHVFKLINRTYNIGTTTNPKWMDLVITALEASIVPGTSAQFPNYSWYTLDSGGSPTRIPTSNSAISVDKNILNIRTYDNSKVVGNYKLEAVEPSTGLSDSRTFQIQVSEDSSTGCPAATYVAASDDPVASAYGITNRFSNSTGKWLLHPNYYITSTNKATLALASSSTSGAFAYNDMAINSRFASDHDKKNNFTCNKDIPTIAPIISTQSAGAGCWSGNIQFQCQNNKWKMSGSCTWRPGTYRPDDNTGTCCTRTCAQYSWGFDSDGNWVSTCVSYTSSCI